ncbi:MAG: response regulator [Planctomycetes bacterium]|nr:response regulator [Planctomycetota bacterium]
MLPLKTQLREINILIVDDDKEDLYILSDLVKRGLTESRVNISSAHSVQDALSMIRTRRFDLFIFDYILSNASGFGLLQAVKDQNIVTPVVIATGFGDEETAVRAIKSGAEDYISKNKLSVDYVSRVVKSALGIQVKN